MASDPFAGFAPAGPDLSQYSDAQLQQMLAAAQAQQGAGKPAPVPPPAADPYAGIGTPAPLPPQAAAGPASDPYAGIGTPAPLPQQAAGSDPFAGFASAPPSGTVDLSKLSDAQLQAMLDARKAEAGQRGPAAPLTIRGTPQNAGDALDVVEGTGRDAYDAGPAEGGATYGDRLRSLGGAVVAGLDGAANAIPFTDRLAALAAAGTGIGGKFGDYSGNLAQLRSEEGQAMAANPGAALAGGLVGGAALPVGAAADVLKDATLAGKVAAGAKAGAYIGGLQGASASPDLGNVRQTAVDAGFGGLAGAGVGGVVPALGAGAGAAVRGLAGRAVQEAPGVPTAARQMVVDAIRNDDPAAVMARLRQLGPSATLADLGPSLQGIAMGQAVKDGPGAAVVLNNLAARQGGASDRVLSDVGQAIGPAQNADAYGRSIADVSQAASAPFYDRAAAAGQPYTPELAALTVRPAVSSALGDAATSAANAGRPLGSITLDAAGNPVSSDAAVQALEAGQRPAVTDALAQLMGTTPGAPGPLAATDALMAQRSAAADPLYTAYRSMQVPMTDELAEVMNRPSVQAAIPSAERKAADQGRTIYAAQQGPYDVPTLTPEGIDYLKRALGDRIDTAQRAGNRDDARVFTGLQQQLLGAIERHPDPAIADAYGAARRAYAGPSREIDALNAGRAAFGDNVSPEQVQREYAALATDGERQRYRQGMFSAGSEKLSKAGDTSNFVRTVSGNQALRDKFAAVAPHQGALDVFNGHIARAQQQFTQATQPTPEALRATLGTLDARVAKAGDPGVTAARDDLAAYLARNPDFARARGIEQDYAVLQNALTAGRTALRGGDTAVHPDDYASAFAGLSPAGQAAQRLGLGDAIYRKLGDTRNDLTAINDVVKGPNDRSRAVIGTTFGQGAADHLAAAADREGVFAKTYNDVLQGSMTARRLAMQKAQADAEVEPYQIHGVHDLTWEGAALTGAAKVVNPLLRLFQQPVDNTARDLALSRIVTTPGETRTAMLARLLRAQNAEDANAALGAPVERGVTLAGAISPAAMAAVLRGRQQPAR